MAAQKKYTTYAWYKKLKKPSWAPPSFLFAPVWSVLYILIAVSFTFVFVQIVNKRIPLPIGTPFILNLICNALFTPIQFGLRSNKLAAIDIMCVLITLIWLMAIIFSYSPWVSYIQIPYLLWVMFATILQLSVTYLNL